MIFTLFVFLVVLLVLVLAHEAGHFFVARRFGVKVREFGFGFPPRIYAWLRHGTEYSINAIPLGGFVSLKGEDGADAEDHDSFAHKKAWQRVLILLAGVVMNALLAYVFTTIALGVGFRGEVTASDVHLQARDQAVTVMGVLAKSPAALAGIMAGDEILQVNGHSLTVAENLPKIIQAAGAKPAKIILRRAGVAKEISATPTEIRPGFLGIGVQLADVGDVRYPFPYVLWQGVKDCGWMIKETGRALGGVVGGLITKQSVGVDVAGPIGIARITGAVARTGVIPLLQLMALLSINLALLNVLPFPALDGGRILFILLEKVLRRKVRAEIERAVHLVGFGLLMLLVVAVTYHDIVGLFK